MKKLFYQLSNILLTLSGIAAVIGLIYTAKPEAFEWLFKMLNLNEGQIGILSVGLGAITIFGGFSKFLKGSLNGDQKIFEINMQRELLRQKELHKAELDNIKEDRSKDYEMFSVIVNELIDQVNHLSDVSHKILGIQAITAKRNIESALVSDEDKELYKSLLESIKDDQSAEVVKNLYTNIEIKEIVLKDEVEEAPEIARRNWGE